jgi:hypothetical protein
MNYTVHITLGMGALPLHIWKIKETKIADLPDFDVCGMLFKCVYDDRYLFFPPSWFI